MKLRDCFTLGANSVFKSKVVNEDDEYYYIAPEQYITKVKKTSVYFKKNKAQYVVFKNRILSGDSKVRNFKGSKYYDYYIERATKENPELLI